MTQQRANQQFRSSINNIYAGSSTIASNPLIKALIPNKKDELFLTYCLSLHPYDVKMTMIDYLNNGYIYNTIDSLKSFINRIYMNVLDVDAYTNYDINLKYILDNDDSYFNKRKYNDLFFN
ncbi:MAG: hypothetical protein HUJ68_00135 [Clostridia bacterium]|nr:hypothetical protein [Clostridia bacterium]